MISGVLGDFPLTRDIWTVTSQMRIWQETDRALEKKGGIENGRNKNRVDKKCG